MKGSLVASFYYQISLCESKSHSCPTLVTPCTIYSPWNSPGQKTGALSLSLLQGIFPTLGSNPGLPHCRWILYQLSHKGSPRILEPVACRFSRGSSRTRNWAVSPALQADSLPVELSGSLTKRSWKYVTKNFPENTCCSFSSSNYVPFSLKTSLMA